MNCKNCQNLLPEGATVCPVCGTDNSVLQTQNLNSENTVVPTTETLNVDAPVQDNTISNQEQVTPAPDEVFSFEPVINENPSVVVTPEVATNDVSHEQNVQPVAETSIVENSIPEPNISFEGFEIPNGDQTVNVVSEVSNNNESVVQEPVPAPVSNIQPEETPINNVEPTPVPETVSAVEPTIVPEVGSTENLNTGLTMEPVKKKNNKTTNIILIILVLVIAGSIAYMFLKPDLFSSSSSGSSSSKSSDGINENKGEKDTIDYTIISDMVNSLKSQSVTVSQSVCSNCEENDDDSSDIDCVGKLELTRESINKIISKLSSIKKEEMHSWDLGSMCNKATLNISEGTNRFEIGIIQTGEVYIADKTDFANIRMYYVLQGSDKNQYSSEINSFITSLE